MRMASVSITLLIALVVYAVGGEHTCSTRAPPASTPITTHRINGPANEQDEPRDRERRQEWTNTRGSGSGVFGNGQYGQKGLFGGEGDRADADVSSSEETAQNDRVRKPRHFGGLNNGDAFNGRWPTNGQFGGGQGLSSSGQGFPSFGGGQRFKRGFGFGGDNDNNNEFGGSSFPGGQFGSGQFGSGQFGSGQDFPSFGGGQRFKRGFGFDGDNNNGFGGRSFPGGQFGSGQGFPSFGGGLQQGDGQRWKRGFGFGGDNDNNNGGFGRFPGGQGSGGGRFGNGNYGNNNGGFGRFPGGQGSGNGGFGWGNRDNDNNKNGRNSGGWGSGRDRDNNGGSSWWNRDRKN